VGGINLFTLIRIGDRVAMKAVLLAGGYATRLRPLTLTRPKPLLPILGRPLILWLIDNLKRAGVRELVISVKYMSNQIVDLLGDGSELDMSIEYVEENHPLGDAGPLRLIDKKVGLSETFLVLYGDVFSDVDVRAVIDFHKSKNALMTLTAVRVDSPERYGILSINEEGAVINFVEKPTYRPQSNLANAGVYVFEPEVLTYVYEDKKQKISVDLMPKVLRTGRVYAYVHDGIWFDIGIPEDYLKANIVALNALYPSGFVANNSEVRGEVVGPVYIGSEVVVGKGSIVGPNSVLLDQVSVGDFSMVKGSVVMKGSRIGSSTYIKNSVVGESCSIGNWVRIESGTIIGDQVSITDEVFVNKRNYILPYKEISESIWNEGGVVL